MLPSHTSSTLHTVALNQSYYEDNETNLPFQYLLPVSIRNAQALAELDHSLSLECVFLLPCVISTALGIYPPLPTKLPFSSEI